MALKTFINGNSVNLTPVGKPPVAFANGVKKHLIKGITFINGQKVQLWNTNELKITVIDLNDVNGADINYPIAFFANKNRLLYSSNNNINRLDISNLGDIKFDTSVALGMVQGFSSVDSTAQNAVFYACFTGSSMRTFNQLNVGTGDGSVVAANSQSFSVPSVGNYGVNACAYTDGWVNANATNNSARVTYVKKGNTGLYNYRTYTSDTGVSISGGGYSPRFTKLNANTLVGRLQRYNENLAFAEFNDSGFIVRGLGAYQDFLVDGNKVAMAGASGFGLFSVSTTGNYNEISTSAPVDAYHTERLIGACRGVYYTVNVPTNVSSDGKFYLRVYNSNGVLFDSRGITGIPSTYYLGSSPAIVPQLSQTGYLTFGDGNRRVVLIQCY